MNRDIGHAEKAIAVDVSGGDQDMPTSCRAIYVGGAGNLAVTMNGGGNVTYTGLQAGSVLPIGVSVVLQGGTTATGLVALL